jgi:hypothetical protein
MPKIVGTSLFLLHSQSLFLKFTTLMLGFICCKLSFSSIKSNTFRVFRNTIDLNYIVETLIYFFEVLLQPSKEKRLGFYSQFSLFNFLILLESKTLLINFTKPMDFFFISSVRGPY